MHFFARRSTAYAEPASSVEQLFHMYASCSDAFVIRIKRTEVAHHSLGERCLEVIHTLLSAIIKLVFNLDDDLFQRFNLSRDLTLVKISCFS